MSLNQSKHQRALPNVPAMGGGVAAPIVAPVASAPVAGGGGLLGAIFGAPAPAPAAP